MTLKVVDLSNNNNSKKLNNYPADAYIFKATEGTYFVDKYCDIMVQQAIKKKKPFGVYHFLDSSNWKKQADFFINNIKGYIGKGIIILDYEAYGMQGASIALKWLDYVYKKTGVRPLIYMSQSTTNADNWKQVAKDYALWVAQYNNKLGHVGYWKTITMWQYTSKPYDKSNFYGKVEAWNKLANKSKQKPPKINQKAVDNVADDVIEGLYGTGSKRKENIYNKVQKSVNKKFKK